MTSKTDLLLRIKELEQQDQDLKEQIKTLKNILNSKNKNKLTILIGLLEEFLETEFENKDGSKIKGNKAIITRLFSIMANDDDKTTLSAIKEIRELLQLKYNKTDNFL